MNFDNDAIINNKNEALEKLTKYLNTCIEQDNAHMKKANLISYWLKDYTRYIEQEETFNSYLLKEYKYGDVIKANLGFNVGNEEGGLHYCVVLDKYNAKNYSTLTIVPLTSVKPTTKIHSTSVPLGNELRIKIRDKAQNLLDSIDVEKAASFHHKAVQAVHFNNHKILKEITDEEKQAIDDFNDKIEIINKILSEAEQMKKGSIALVNQITTISKQRIYNPKNDLDILSDIRISDDKMELITNKIQKLFIKK